MKILITIKSILNYLYNNLIDLVYVKKVKFQDGTEMTTAGSSSGGGFSLYDIKTLAETVANKGWCCISNKKVLPKTSNPTVYNDIKNKYDNCDLGSTGSLTKVTSLTLCYETIFKDGYIYRIKATQFYPTIQGIFKAQPSDLGNDEDWQKVCDLPTEYNGVNLGNLQAYFGNNIIVVRFSYNDINLLYVYDYNGNLIKIIEIGNQIDGGYNKFSIMNGYLYFTQVVTGKTYGIDLYKIQDLASNTIAPEFVANVEYDIVNLKFAFNKYWFIYQERDSLYCATDLNDNSTYEKKVDNCGMGTCIIDNNDFQYIKTSGLGKVSNDGGATFMSVTYNLAPYITNVQNNLLIQRETNDKCIEIIVGTDSDSNPKMMIAKVPYGQVNIYTGDSLSSIDYPWQIVACWSDDFCFYISGYDYYFVGLEKKVFTDTYNIGGNTISINYYKYTYTQQKIVLGTSQNTDIDTVTEYLGYNPYIVLDTTYNSENVQLPINTNLWTYMFVGDNFIDDNIPTGNYINLKTVGETVVNDNASVTVDIKANKHYKFTNANITDITINSVEDSVNETVIKFSTGNTAPTLTDNSGIDWYDGVPVLNANSSYTIVIYDSTAYWLEK